MQALVDYASLTFFDTYSPLELQIIISGTSDWTPRKTGFRNYLYSYQYGSMIMAWGGQPGIHVCIPGQGCRELDALNPIEWQERVATWLQIGGRFTRLDVAIDDKSGMLNIDTIKSTFLARRTVTHLTKHQDILSGDTNSKSPQTGRTFYMGSRKSNTMIRVYDKGVEQGVDGHWIRMELEVRDERAQGVALAIAERGMEAIPGILEGIISFREDTGRTRADNEKVVGWWSTFLEAAKGIKLVIEATTKTWRDTAKWVQHTVASSLAMIRRAGVTMEELGEWIDSGDKRLTSRHRLLLEAGGIR